MSTLKINSLQIGQSLTAANNFTWYQPTTPDGTARLGNGNPGSVTDLLTINSSGNVGIGTSSPVQKLDVNGIIRSSYSAPSAYTACILENTSSSGYSELLLNVGSNGANGQAAIGYAPGIFFAVGPTANDTTTPLVFRNNNATERMRLDSAGNLGLGVTPSAWGGGYKAFELISAGSALWSSGVTDIRMSANMYYNSGYKYAGTGAATRYEQSSGVHAWLNAPSGTAGNTISFTQAMTLDEYGRLFVGFTSGGALGRINSYNADNSYGLVLQSGTYGLRALSDTGNGGFSIQAVNGNASVSYQPLLLGGGGVRFFTGTAGGGTQTEAARISSTGNFGIGTNSPVSKLQVVESIAITAAGGGQYLLMGNQDSGGINKPSMIVAANANLMFGVGNSWSSATGGTFTEFGRFDTSGNFMVGTTSTSSKLYVKGSSSILSSYGLGTSATFTIQADNIAGSNPALYLESPGTIGGGMYINRANATLRVWNSGDTTGVYLASGGTSWATYSDEREKEIIHNIEGAVEKVSTLRAVIGRYKTDDLDKRRSFLIAQDVQKVLPEAVDTSDPDKLGVQYTDTIPLLVAAIKELSAKIDSQQNEINTLKSLLNN